MERGGRVREADVRQGPARAGGAGEKTGEDYQPQQESAPSHGGVRAHALLGVAPRSHPVLDHRLSPGAVGRAVLVEGLLQARVGGTRVLVQAPAARY